MQARITELEAKEQTLTANNTQLEKTLEEVMTSFENAMTGVSLCWWLCVVLQVNISSQRLHSMMNLMNNM